MGRPRFNGPVIMVDETCVQRIDKLGSPFDVRYCTFQQLHTLTKMYDEFSPKAVSQGLPPSDEATRRAWVEKLLTTAENFVAWWEGKAIGHCAMVPDLARRDAEYIIFVDQPYRNRGIGTELTAMAVARARELGLSAVWLTVEAFNFRALRLYRRVGFQFTDEVERERTMVLHL
jgi:RimJ/RimL family protein N-acetyltransferase